MEKKHQLEENINYKLKINNEELERVKIMKYLGVQLDECLDFNEHTNYITDKVTKKICVIHKSHNVISQQIALTLYKSLVSPHFEYCSLVYECTSKHNLNWLQLTQNQGSHVILRADRYEMSTTCMQL